MVLVMILSLGFHSVITAAAVEVSATKFAVMHNVHSGSFLGINEFMKIFNLRELI